MNIRTQFGDATGMYASLAIISFDGYSVGRVQIIVQIRTTRPLIIKCWLLQHVWLNV